MQAAEPGNIEKGSKGSDLSNDLPAASTDKQANAKAPGELDPGIIPKDNIISEPTKDNEQRESSNIKEPEKTEINLEQNNIADAANSQVNTTSLIFEKLSSGSLNINVSSQSSIAVQSLHFRETGYKNYQKTISVLKSEYLTSIKEETAEVLNKTRMLVINSQMHDEAIVMTLIETFAFDKKLFTNARIFICQIEDLSISLDTILNQFQNKKIERRKTEQCFIIIYPPNKKEGSAEFLTPLLTKGGISDSFTEMLNRRNIFLVCLQNDVQLYRRSVKNKAHCCLIHLSELHFHLFEVTRDKKSDHRTKRLLETAISEYDWISTLTLHEKKETISKLVEEGTFETKLSELIRNTDEEENKIIKDLIKDPLHNVIMFVASFFDGISLNEFDGLVRSLIPQQKSEAISEETDIFGNRHLQAWELNGDEILTKCGIACTSVKNGLAGLSFESRARLTNTRKIFLEKYNLSILRRYEIMEESLFIPSENLSDAFVDSMTEIIFCNARINMDKYLKNSCLKIAEHLDNPEYNENHLRALFFRLLLIIKRWEDSDEFSCYIKNFYHSLLNTPTRRSLLGAILTYVCVPQKPQTLVHLKTLLDSAGDDEYFIKIKLIRSIAVNYGEYAGDLLTSIEGWSSPDRNNIVSRSFSFAKCSLLLSFYEKRFDWNSTGGIDHYLIRIFAKDLSPSRFKDLIQFTLSDTALPAFRIFFYNVISRQIKNKSAIEQILMHSYYSLVAYILIRWYHLLEEMKAENKDLAPDVDGHITEAFLIIKGTAGINKILTALQEAINKYNYLIIQAKESNEVKKERKKGYIIFRDTARQVKQLGEQINSRN